MDFGNLRWGNLQKEKSFFFLAEAHTHLASLKKTSIDIITDRIIHGH